MTNGKQYRADSSFEVNRKLLRLLSDDKKRARLYRRVRAKAGGLKFQSRADIKEKTWLDRESAFRQEVVLLASRAHVLRALREQENFSNDPYRALGSGTFMLGLDNKDRNRQDDYNHERQREFAKAFIDVSPRIVQALANVAFKAAAVLPLKQRSFDLVELAGQAATRFVGSLFGFGQGDSARVEDTMRRAYRGLNYLILARHFVSLPGVVDDASKAMGDLLVRVAELIDLYRAPIGRDQEDELKRLNDELAELQAFEDRNGHKPLEKFTPLLQVLARRAPPDGKEYSGAELAVLVVGMIVGTIGNIQASVCIAVNEFFENEEVFQLAKEAAGESMVADPDYCDAPKLENLIWEALRLNPPAAFLPRRTTTAVTLDGLPTIDANTHVVLAIGGATRDKPDGDEFRRNAGKDDRDPLIFGGDGGRHSCIGARLAMPLIGEVVRNVLLLPGLAQRLDPRTGEVLRLEKLWGFNCRNYPLEYTREAHLVQSPLIVIMRVRTPVSEHAEALKKVIAYGAPRIEKKLKDSEHVHFASFIFLENDSKLALYTVYDRDFDAYIEHFALEIGPLFDRIFAHIQDPPPLPVNEYPREFVDTIRRHNNRPAADYFFSAYPTATAASIIHDFEHAKR